MMDLKPNKKFAYRGIAPDIPSGQTGLFAQSLVAGASDLIHEDVLTATANPRKDAPVVLSNPLLVLMESVHTGVTGLLGLSAKDHAEQEQAELVNGFASTELTGLTVAQEVVLRTSSVMFKNVPSGVTGRRGQHVQQLAEVV